MVRPVKTYDSVTERSFILVLLFFFVWLIDWIIISKQNQHTAVFQALTPTWYNLSEVDIFTWQQPHITFIYSSTTLVLFQHVAGFVFFSGVTHFPPANQQQRRSSCLCYHLADHLPCQWEWDRGITVGVWPDGTACAPPLQRFSVNQEYGAVSMLMTHTVWQDTVGIKPQT